MHDGILGVICGEGGGFFRPVIAIILVGFDENCLVGVNGRDGEGLVFHFSHIGHGAFERN